MGWNPVKDIRRGIRNIAGRGGLNIVDNPFVSSIAGGLIGGGGGALTGAQLTGVIGQPPKPPKMGPNKELEQIRKEMGNEASAFRANLGNYTGQQFGGLLRDAQEAQKQGTRSINENYQRRGLLYSGIRAGKEGDLKQGIASGLAQGRLDINREAEALARSKEAAAASMSLDIARSNQARAEELYNIQMQNQLARRRAIGQLAGGIGRGIGAAYGSKEDAATNDSRTGITADNREFDPNLLVSKLQRPGLINPYQQQGLNFYGIKRMNA